MRTLVLCLMLFAGALPAEEDPTIHRFTIGETAYWLQLTGRHEGRSFILEYAVICAATTPLKVSVSQINDDTADITINGQAVNPAVGSNVYIILPHRVFPIGELRGPSIRAALIVYLEALAKHLLNPESDDRRVELPLSQPDSP